MNHAGVRPLLLASAITVGLSFVPYASVITYPFLIFSTFIHETAHALAAILTLGSVQSITISHDGSGMTYSSGGIRLITASAGYVGTALFGAMLLILSRDRKRVRATLIGCALLVAVVTALFIGHAANAVILAGLAVVAALVAARRKTLTWVAAGISVLLIAYLALSGSLFSWAVGLFLSLGLFGIVRYASYDVAHFFLSFLAVQCSLNSLQSLRVLFSLSLEGSCVRTDAQTMASLTGLPAWLWAVLWIAQAVVILGLAIRYYRKP